MPSKILEVLYIKRPLYKYTAVQARDKSRGTDHINWQYIYRKPRGSSKGPAEGIKREKAKRKKKHHVKKATTTNRRTSTLCKRTDHNTL